jgi:hypothetical protein
MVYRKKELRPFRLVGITGGKGHGKDTFANFVKASGRSGASFQTKHFAAPLKDIVAEVFGLNREHMDDPIEKERQLSSPIPIDLHLEALKTKTGLPLTPKGLTAESLRHLLQYVGTDYVRAVAPNYWVDRAAEAFVASNTLVPDVRFPNEAATVKKVGGMLIKILRIDMPDSGDGHASETSMDGVSVDLVVGVRTGDLRISERVAHLLALGKYDYLPIYDYRNVRKALEAYQGGKGIKVCTDLLGIKNQDSAAFRFILDYYGVPQRKISAWKAPHGFDGDGVETKQCNGCKAWKPLSSFSRSSKSWDNYHGVCKTCAAQWHRDNYQRYAKSKDLTGLFRVAKNQAKLRGKVFELELADLQAVWDAQGGLCHYTRLPMTFIAKDHFKVSLDRLDPAGGYTRGNVVLCASTINLMKRNLTLPVFESMVKALSDNVDKWGSL